MSTTQDTGRVTDRERQSSIERQNALTNATNLMVNLMEQKQEVRLLTHRQIVALVKAITKDLLKIHE